MILPVTPSFRPGVHRALATGAGGRNVPYAGKSRGVGSGGVTASRREAPVAVPAVASSAPALAAQAKKKSEFLRGPGRSCQ